MSWKNRLLGILMIGCLWMGFSGCKATMQRSWTNTLDGIERLDAWIKENMW